MTEIENIHIRTLTPLVTPEEVKALYPAEETNIATVTAGREAVRNLVATPDTDNKLAVVAGPCSIHDPKAAVEYAGWLMGMREEYGDELEILMRVYFEKPRTTVGWKGLINDPHLDESYDINTGLKVARELLHDITSLGMPVGTELLDTMTPQYFADFVSWGAIGARTTESQLHRELASGLSFPVGFKNGTSGNTQIAVDAVSAAAHPHRFLAITNSGAAAIAATSGNPDCHVVLRGGSNGPNYDRDSILSTVEQLEKAGRPSVVMIDTSHANSGKNHKRQIEVVRDIGRQVSAGCTAIMGVMIESNLREGAQKFTPGGQHEYGVSITDACVDLDETETMLNTLANAVKNRRKG